MARYLRNLSIGRLILWCYCIWYLVVLEQYFVLDPRLWLTALGTSVVIGAALLINTTRSGKERVTLEFWPAARLFLFPFCVSSFSSLVKGKGFILIFSPHPGELVVAIVLCAALCIARWLARRFSPR